MLSRNESPTRNIRSERGECRLLRVSDMYAVMGVTGQVGGQVANALLAAGQRVRAILRDEAKAGPWIEHGCEIRSHKLMVRFAPAVSFLFQAVSLTFCLRLQGSHGPFFAAPHVPEMTEFVIWKPAAHQAR